MVQEYVQQRQRVCTLSHVSLQLTHFVLEVLRLLPSDTSSNTPSSAGASTTSLQGSGGSGKGGVTGNGAGVGGGARNATPIQVLAKQASWVLLTEEAAFQVFILTCGLSVLCTSGLPFSFNSVASLSLTTFVCILLSMYVSNRSCSTWPC